MLLRSIGSAPAFYAAASADTPKNVSRANLDPDGSASPLRRRDARKGAILCRADEIERGSQCPERPGEITTV